MSTSTTPSGGKSGRMSMPFSHMNQATAKVKEELRHTLNHPKTSITTALDTALSNKMVVMDASVYEIDTVKRVATKASWTAVLRKPSFWIRVGLVVLVVVAAICINLLLPKGFWLGFFNLLNAMGPWARVVYFFLMVGLTLISVPPTITLLFGGFLLGFWWTLAIGHVAHLIGSSGSYFLGKYLIGNRIHNNFKDNKFFRALEIAVERSSLKISIMLRLCPILPIVAVTYMLAVTRVKYWHFVVATGIFLIPEVCLYVYLGSTASSVTQALSSGAVDVSNASRLSIMVICLILSIVMAAGVSLITKHEVDKILKEEKAREKQTDIEAGEEPSVPLLDSRHSGDDTDTVIQ